MTSEIITSANFKKHRWIENRWQSRTRLNEQMCIWTWPLCNSWSLHYNYLCMRTFLLVQKGADKHRSSAKHGARVCPTTWERYGWSHSYAEQTFIVMSKCKRSGRNACRPASWIAKETVKILIRHHKTNFSHRDMAGLNKKSNQQNPISSGNKSCEPADRNICAFVNSNSALGVKKFKSQQR